MKYLSTLLIVIALLIVALPAGAQGGILFEDDFSDATTGWEIADYETGDVGYGKDYYFVTSEGNGDLMWGVLDGINGSNVTIDVDATQVMAPGNDNNGYGVMCHVQEDLQSGYILRISGDGYANITLIEEEEFIPLYEWTTATAVNMGNSLNTLQAVCAEGRLELYANGQLVAEAMDTTYTNGTIALAATSFEDDDLTEIRFDNLVLYGEVSTISSGGKEVTTPTTDDPPDNSTALFEDDFSSESSGWEIGDYSDGTVGYGADYYYVTSAGNEIIMWGMAPDIFPGNVSIAVETTQAVAPSNNNNGYGVMCHVQDNQFMGYILLISGDGYAAIGIADEEGTTALSEWTPANSVNLGNASNYIEAVCADGMLQLYANGELVAEAFDNTYTSGGVGLIAASYELTEGTEIHFDNIIVNGSMPATGTSTSGGKN